MHKHLQDWNMEIYLQQVQVFYVSSWASWCNKQNIASFLILTQKWSLGLQCLRGKVEYQFIEVFVHYFFILNLPTEAVATPDYFEM